MKVPSNIMDKQNFPNMVGFIDLIHKVVMCDVEYKLICFTGICDVEKQINITRRQIQ